MALTAEQKEANKEARRVRDRAFRLRYDEHRKALDAGKAAALAEIKPEFDAAKAVTDAIEAERMATREDFDRRIADLTAERDATLEALRIRYVAARDVQSEIWVVGQFEFSAAQIFCHSSERRFVVTHPHPAV